MFYLLFQWAELCNAFLVETRWLSSGHLPNTEEYLKNGIISSGVYVVSANIFSLLGEAVNHRSTILFNSHPDIVSSAARILRLWDDLGTSKVCTGLKLLHLFLVWVERIFSSSSI